MNGAHLFVVSILIKVILIKGLLHELSLPPGRLPLEDLRVCSTDGGPPKKTHLLEGLYKSHVAW